MKSSFSLIAALALLTSSVLADNTCGGDCYSSSVPDSVCGVASDWPCLCKDTNYLSSVNTCVQTQCSDENDRLVGYYTLWQICHIFNVQVGGPEQSAADVASTSSITGLPNDLSSFSALTSGILTGPGIIGVSVTSQAPITSPTTTISDHIGPSMPIASEPITIESTFSGPPGPTASFNTTANPGGPISSVSTSVIMTTPIQSNPGGPIMSTTPTITTAPSVNPGGPIQSATTSTPAASTTAGSASSASGLHVEVGFMLTILCVLLHAAITL